MSTQARRPKQGQGGGHQAGEVQRTRRCPGPNPAPSSLTSPCPQGEQGPEDTHTHTRARAPPSPGGHRPEGARRPRGGMLRSRPLLSFWWGSQSPAPHGS